MRVIISMIDVSEIQILTAGPATSDLAHQKRRKSPAGPVSARLTGGIPVNRTSLPRLARVLQIFRQIPEAGRRDFLQPILQNGFAMRNRSRFAGMNSRS